MVLSPRSQVNAGEQTRYCSFKIGNIDLGKMIVHFTRAMRARYAPSVNNRERQPYGECGIYTTLQRASVYQSRYPVTW